MQTHHVQMPSSSSSSYCLKLVSDIEMSNSTIFTPFIKQQQSLWDFIFKRLEKNKTKAASVRPSVCRHTHTHSYKHTAHTHLYKHTLVQKNHALNTHTHSVHEESKRHTTHTHTHTPLCWTYFKLKPTSDQTSSWVHGLYHKYVITSTKSNHMDHIIANLTV